MHIWDLKKPLAPEEQEQLDRLKQSPHWPAWMRHMAKVREDLAKAPRISNAAGKVLDAMVNKGKGGAFPHANTVSDFPTTCTKAVEMAGVKGRASVNELVAKGLLHSYGRRHGFVPTAFLHHQPGHEHWQSLTGVQKRILALFFNKPWKHCLDGTEIATALGRAIGAGTTVGDENLRREIRGLVRIKALRHMGKRGGYRPDPTGWPTDTPGSPFCPAADYLVWTVSWRKQMDQHRDHFFGTQGPFCHLTRKNWSRT